MNTYSITNRPTLLQYRDMVVFTVKGESKTYEVKWNYLNMVGHPFNNREIFNLLDLDHKAFALSSYGYSDKGGDWPESRNEDYPALTRLVNALYHLIAEREPDQITEAQSKPEAKPRPKVGDRVRLVPLPDTTPEYTGREGIVIEDDRTRCPFQVEFGSGERMWCRENRVEVIPTTPMTTMTPEAHLDAYLLYLFPLSSGLRTKARAILDVLSKP